MFRFLKTGLAGLTPEECDLLENYVLTWEIHGTMWLRDVDWTDNPDGYGAPWNDRRQARLDRVNGLRRRVREPLAALNEGLKAGKTAGEKVDALYAFWSVSTSRAPWRNRCAPRRTRAGPPGGGGDGPAVGDSLRHSGPVRGDSGG